MFYLTTHSHTFYLQLYGRKEIFYLTTHSTHFIYSYMEGRKELFYLTTHSTHFIFRASVNSYSSIPSRDDTARTQKFKKKGMVVNFFKYLT